VVLEEVVHQTHKAVEDLEDVLIDQTEAQALAIENLLVLEENAELANLLLELNLYKKSKVNRFGFFDFIYY
jgi:hypothetical protein